jgi:predicted O-linked N-acetylglucosamine transferase (SPINDLY family)
MSDAWTSPAGTEDEYTESLHRLASGYLVYEPPPHAPPPAPSAAAANGFVTFGLIQQLMKIGPDVWDAIARVLQATPGSQLLIHNSDRELSRLDSETRTFVCRQMTARDIDPARLRIVGRLEHREHLDLLGDIDIALDSWPFTGTTTTCECLWMGVPVVTRAGRTHASRVSAGLLRRLGLDEWIGANADAYVNAAVRLANDVDALIDHRATLRNRAVASDLTNGPALARAMEHAYAQWCGSAGRT